MSKTTKRVVPVRSIQRFNNDGLKSVTISDLVARVEALELKTKG